MSPPRKRDLLSEILTRQEAAGAQLNLVLHSLTVLVAGQASAATAAADLAATVKASAIALAKILEIVTANGVILADLLAEQKRVIGVKVTPDAPAH